MLTAHAGPVVRGKAPPTNLMCLLGSRKCAERIKHRKRLQTDSRNPCGRVRCGQGLRKRWWPRESELDFPGWRTP
jgi:hypothetical protein